VNPGRIAAIVVLVVQISVIATSPAAAIGWGGIEPAVTSLEQVRERWGPPTKETRARDEGHETIQWVYEGTGAPEGLNRMIVDFGLRRSDGYKPHLVRSLKLEPKPMIFGRNTVVEAFGAPDRVGIQDDLPLIVYNTGLFVYFDREGQTAVLLLFTPPLPVRGSGDAPSGPTPRPGDGAGQPGPATAPR
jgi:hypothetical protein